MRVLKAHSRLSCSLRVPIAYGRSNSVIQATRKLPGCAQRKLVAASGWRLEEARGNEDCLHLNVWTPCTAITEPSCRKAVLVFFFATGFQNGDNNRYDGAFLAALGDIVLVAPNFRLGAFGFLTTRSKDTGIRYTSSREFFTTASRSGRTETRKEDAYSFNCNVARPSRKI